MIMLHAMVLTLHEEEAELIKVGVDDGTEYARITWALTILGVKPGVRMCGICALLCAKIIPDKLSEHSSNYRSGFHTNNITAITALLYFTK
jgi:hypothetical protein